VLASALNALALGLELVAAAIVFLGAVATVRTLALGLVRKRGGRWKRDEWLHFAVWIGLSLEFALAGDIVASLVAPTWDELGKLAVLATVRTLLNFFLSRDLEHYGAVAEPPAAASR
jgi:uncharacterized membrane protein